jgi:hypothetical protein
MADGTSLIKVHVGNPHYDCEDSVAFALPVTEDEIERWFDVTGSDGDDPTSIGVKDIESSMDDLAALLRRENATLSELNYLAAKLAGLGENGRGVVEAAIEAKRCGQGIAGLMNLTENLDRLDLLPLFSEEEYGAFRITSDIDGHADAVARLLESDDWKDVALAAFIEKLAGYADKRAYGRDAIEEGGGIFTERGLLFGGEGLVETYRGPQDIPWEFRLFSEPAPKLSKAPDVELAPFLAKLHAVAGEYEHDIRYNLDTLAALRSSEYLLLLDKKSAYLVEAAHAYRKGTTAFDVWMGASKAPGTHALAIHVTEVSGSIIGDVEELDLSERQRDIFNYSIRPIAIKATLENGETVEYSPAEWEGLSVAERSRAESWRREFRDGDYSEVHQHLAETSDGLGLAKTVRADDLLDVLNTAYRDRSRCAADGFLRVSGNAAREMLARGDADVFHLLPEGATKLGQIDAVRGTLWLVGHQEFAIRQKDMSKLDGWARRSAKAVLDRTARRDRQEKSHGEEL